MSSQDPQQFPVDLHAHSNFSPDAQYPPNEVFAQAKAAGLTGLVITDHNGTKHFADALAAAKEHGLDTCQGIEITANFEESDVHVLGYSLNFDIAVLDEGLQQTIDGYNERTRAITNKVVEAGLAKIDFDELQASLPSPYVSKPNVGQEIAKQQGIPYPEAIKLVERGGPGYVPYGKWALKPEQAIEIINHAGGKAVLAHPGDFFTTRSSVPEAERWQMVERLIMVMVEAGLYGIEAFYVKHTKEQIERFQEFAVQHELVETGGTDWHGEAFKPDRKLGLGGGVPTEQFKRILRDLSS
jgi:hypothetical protein